MKHACRYLAILMMLVVSTGVAKADALQISGEVFVTANVDTFSINAFSGVEERNKAALPVSGTAQRLYVLSNLQPAAGSMAHVCVRINGVDSSLCVDYSSSDWPNPKGNLVNSIAISRNSEVSLHFSETGGTATGANMRATFEVLGDEILESGFETSLPGGEINTPMITGEQLMVANADAYSIMGGFSGTSLVRNRVAMPRSGILRRLTVLPNVQPAPGSLLQGCLNVNGVDSSSCVNYSSSDWPGSKVDMVNSSAVVQGDLLSVHFRELMGINSGANLRASMDFAGAEGSGVVTVTDEPFMTSGVDTFSIAGGVGVEERNSAVVPRNGQIDNLFVMPNLQPAAGSLIRVCVRVNGSDSSLCADYSAGQWPSSVGTTGVQLNVNEGDRISVRFRELNGVASGSNIRASFTFK